MSKNNDTKMRQSFNTGVNSLVKPSTLKMERTTIFIFFFCIELLTQFDGSVLGVLKHHYITKGICKLLIGNSIFLIHDSCNQLLCNTNINESCLFVVEIVETVDLNN